MAPASQKKSAQAKSKPSSEFYDKLVLNLFLIHLFGIDVFSPQYMAGEDGKRQSVRPFRKLSERLETCTQDGLADDGCTTIIMNWSKGTFRLAGAALSGYAASPTEKNIVAPYRTDQRLPPAIRSSGNITSG